LAQKAGRILDKTILPGWLYQTTRLTASSYLRRETRRVRREQEAFMQSESHTVTPDPTWEQLAPLLEDAMGQLGDNDRTAVVLRFFGGKSFAEVATAAGVSENAAKKRVIHALEKLHRYFSKRGVSSTAETIAGAISANSVQVAPVALAKVVTAAAVAKGAAASGSTLTLIKGALKLMAWTKAKTAVVTGVVLVLAAGGATVIIPKVENARLAQRIATHPVINEANRLNEGAGVRTLVAALRARQWPKERKLEEERIKSRQAMNETTNAVTIDLKPYVNAALAEAPIGWEGNNADNLAELPAGVHIFAGVPFNVEGSIHLMGGWLKHFKKTCPPEVDDIRINRRCAKLHLLHGASFIFSKDFGTEVAKLVLHYTDGSTREISITAGEQVFDWWAPLFTTGVDPRTFKTAQGTERAWAGRNPNIQKWQPDESIVLYKSTFDNPQPNIAISSLDYVSTETDTVPFLLGLTVE